MPGDCEVSREPPFRHVDPGAWTFDLRGNILMGNPRLRAGNARPPAETRFKAWWDLVGSAVEHAAALHAKRYEDELKWLTADPSPCPPSPIRFSKMAMATEADEEQTSSLSTLLDLLRTRWPYGAKGSDVAAYAGQAETGAIEFKAALEQAARKLLPITTATTVTWRLKALVDAPVLVGGSAMALRYQPDKNKNGVTFDVHEVH